MDGTKQGFLRALAADVVYWLACLAVFRSCDATLSGAHPLAEAILCSTCMILGREALQASLNWSRNGAAFSPRLFCARVAYAFAVVAFFLLSIGLVGVLPLLVAMPFFLVLAILYVCRPARGKPDAPPSSGLGRMFSELCAYYGLKGVGLAMLEKGSREVHSELRPVKTVSMSPDAEKLPLAEQQFLLAHELSHFYRRHFQKKAVFELLVVVAQTALPFVAACLAWPQYWLGGHWMPPTHYPVPLLVMTLANWPFLWLGRRFYFHLECQADLDAANATQRPDNALRVMRWSANLSSPDADKEISRRSAALAKRHRRVAPGELEEVCSYLCLTYRCNSRCRFCASDKTGSRDDISVAAVRRFVERDIGPRERLVLSGGEPLLHPHFDEIVGLVRGRYRKICLMTNGTLFAAMPNAVGHVRDGVFANVAIPLYGASAQVHDELTGVKGNWERANEALRMLSGLPTRVDLKLLWSAATMRENLGILDMLEAKELPKPHALSLTHLIVGTKACREYDRFRMDAESHLDILNETVARMSEYDFTLQNIPLCWLSQANLEKVLAREDRPPAVARIRYLCPGGRPVLISHAPEEKDACTFCRLRSRCSRFYPSQKAHVVQGMPVWPIASWG